MRNAVRFAGTVWLLTLLPARAPAQAASALLSEGIQAYTDLDFAAAARLLQRALDAGEPHTLAPSDRLGALMYLGAANLFGGQRDQAVSALRELVLAAPRYRPDSLIFPPRVTQVFHEVLETTKAVSLSAPREVSFSPGARGLVVRVYATSGHRIDARLLSQRGSTLATLFGGRITDSLALSWNGLDSAGNPVRPGRYRIVVTSSVAPNQALRSLSLPLDVALLARDTLPWPAPPPPQTRSRWDARFLLGGAVAGAALAVPAALGLGGNTGPRIALGVTFAAIGVIGARPRFSKQPAAEQEWRSRLAATQLENRRRHGESQMVVRTSPPERRDGTER